MVVVDLAGGEDQRVGNDSKGNEEPHHDNSDVEAWWVERQGEESQHIDQDRTALWDVVRALKDGDSHIPYRQRKVRQLARPLMDIED